MLLSVKLISKVLGVKPAGVVHVGAHQAEEALAYRKYNWGQVLWIDALQENVDYIKNLSSCKSDLWVQALVWSENNLQLRFNVATNGQSSSSFEFGKHSSYHPEVKVQEIIQLKTTRLDKILADSFQYDFLNLDIQGAELEALKGLGEKINSFKFIYTEVNNEKIYQDIPLVNDLDEFLKLKNFKRIITKWTDSGWGDALYLRGDQLTIGMLVKVVFAKIAMGLLQVLNQFATRFR